MFDDYKETPSTKVVTHFSKETICSVTKNQEFLTDPSNKEKLIKMIGESLSEAQCQVKYAGEDTDLDITKIGVKE